MFLGWAVAGEAVTLRTLIAAALVVAAVALIITSRAHRAHREPSRNELSSEIPLAEDLAESQSDPAAP